MAVYTTIDDPSAYFGSVTYTGNGGALAVTFGGNSNLQADLLWHKKRGSSEAHAAHNSTLGHDRFQVVNENYVEQHQPTTGNTDADDIASYDSDGFTFDGGGGAYNQSSNTYVAWGWKANGGSTSANSTGNSTEDAIIQTNTTSNFSIIKWLNTSSDSLGTTVAHGLGVKPGFAMIKDRESTAGWYTFFPASQGHNQSSAINGTAAFGTVSGFANFNTSTFTQGNGTDNEFIMYMWANVQGYSKFGNYTGNGNADGPFIYLGFKPAWILVKETDNTNEWRMYDNKRGPYNPNAALLYANDAQAESSTGHPLDFLANGWKIRGTTTDHNRVSSNYVYAAFAENPFVTSTGIPCTAR